jgi:hypothetical protein
VGYNEVMKLGWAKRAGGKKAAQMNRREIRMSFLRVFWRFALKRITAQWLRTPELKLRS